ncbi:MAG: hypothetical protein O3B37_06280 [Proteobacteria bacterium]|nr:hypothetical protein [Pseudomonadota bacterium]
MRRGFRYGLAIGGAIVGAIAIVLPAHAQQSGVESRESDVRESIETQRDVERTAGDALDLEAFSKGPPVTFQQVLEDPDNIELNVRYALTQIRDGNVRGAGATLERILLIRPDLAVVWVLFAIVLFRLDNLDEAERELQALQELNLEPELRRQTEQYLDQIASRRKRTVFTFAMNFATQYDWNRNASPKSELRLAADLPTRTVGSSSRQDDLAMNGLAQISFEHDLGLQKQHKMLGGLVFYQGEQVQQDDLDLRAITADFGYELDFAPSTITPRVLYERVDLSREKYLTAVGATVDWVHALSNTWSVFASGTMKYQSYNNITSSQTATQRSGREYEFELGTSQILTPRQRVRVTYEQTRNVAARTSTLPTRAKSALPTRCCSAAVIFCSVRSR